MSINKLHSPPPFLRTLAQHIERLQCDYQLKSPFKGFSLIPNSASRLCLLIIYFFLWPVYPWPEKWKWSPEMREFCACHFFHTVFPQIALHSDLKKKKILHV